MNQEKYPGIWFFIGVIWSFIFVLTLLGTILVMTLFYLNKPVSPLSYNLLIVGWGLSLAIIVKLIQKLLSNDK